MVKNTPTIERSTKIRFGKNCTEDQGENTIVFNASNVQIDATQPGAVYMTPIRKRESSDYLNYKMLIYNTETKEIVDSTVPAEDILLLDLERAVINGSVTSNTVSFNHPETSVTTLSNVGVANGAPIHTLDVGTKFYVDEEGANVLTVLGDTYIQDDVIIGGNLDVRGTITSINTENTTIKDAIIEIGKGNTTSDMGLIMDRTGTNVTMGYRESVDEFVIAHTTSSATSSTITPSSELIDARVHGRLHVNSNLTVDTDTLHVDAIRDRVGINTLNPQTDLDVVGNAQVHSDFIVDTDTLFVDASTDRVGINTLTPSTDFHVQGEAYVSGNVTVDTDTFHVDTVNDRVGINTLTPSTDFHVEGDTYVSGNVDVQTNLNVLTDAVVAGNAYMLSNVVVTGNTDVQSELNVTGNAFVSSNLNAQSELNVTGNAFVSSNLNAQSELNVSGNAFVSSNLNAESELNVTGNAFVSSNLNAQSELNVTGNAYILSDAVITGNADVQTDLNVTGNAYVSSNVVVTGNVDVQTNLNVATDAIVTGNVDVQSELNVTGNAYISSNAIVTGNVDVQSELNVTGNAYVSSNVIVTGNVDVQTNLNVATDAIVTGNVDVQTDLNVIGNAYISSNAIVTGNVDVQTDLNVVGDAYVATYYGDGGLLSNVNLQVVSDHGNSTFNTIQFTNATTGMVTTSNLEVGSNISVAGLSINKMPIVGAGNFLEDSSISKVDGKIIISSDVEILGNILVDGSSYTIESNSLVINDRIIGIANNNVSHQLDVGIIIQHPGKNIALVHHGEAVEGDPHDHTFTIGYTQNTVTDNHIFNDSNLITVEILGNLITQNNLIVSETLDVSGTVTFADDLVVGAASNLFVDVSTSRVGINEATPDASLDVGGDVNIQSDVNATSKTSGGLVVAGGVGVGGDVYASNVVLSGDFTVDTDTLIVNSTTDRVGINKAVPTVALDVDGDVVISNDFTVDTNTLHVDSGTDSVGINTATPSANLHVVGNVHVQNATEAFSTTSGAMTITGGLGVTANVHATQFHGDGSKLTGLVTTLEDVANNGNTMSNTIIFENETTSLVTEGSVGIANTAPIHDLDVGSNLYVDDAGPNVLYVTGNVYATRFIGDGAFLENIASNLHEITNNGNVTTNTVHFEGATSIVTTGKIGIANAAPDHELSVTGNVYVSSEVRVAGGLITNLGGLTKKTYGYSSGTITASTTPEINVVFDSELFSAKITAHLVEPTSNISVLNLDVTGGTGRNIGKGMLSIVGDQNSKHWDTVIATTDTTVTLTPSVGLLSDGTYGIFVEYTSPLGGGGVTSIDKDNTNEITFDY